MEENLFDKRKMYIKKKKGIFHNSREKERRKLKDVFFFHYRRKRGSDMLPLLPGLISLVAA